MAWRLNVGHRPIDQTTEYYGVRGARWLMSEPGLLRAAVVGAGTGGQLSIGALARSERFELVAVADSDPAALERLRPRFPAISLWPNADALLAGTSLDVVCVSTYAPTHLPIAAAALRSGVRGLLVEKPLGASTAEARELLDLTAAARVPLVVPHGLMAMSAPLQIIERIRGGNIGTLRFVEIECAGWDIINAGIHWLQFFAALTEDDPAVTVLAAADTSTRTFRDGMQVETEAVTLVRTAAGVRLLMNTGDEIPVSHDRTTCVFRFVGSHGVIEYGAWDAHYAVMIAGRPPAEVEVEPFAVSGHQRHLEHLADQIAAGERDDRIPELSLRALELVEAAYLSHRLGAAVQLPLTSVQPIVEPRDWSPGLPYSGVGGGRDGRRLQG